MVVLTNPLMRDYRGNRVVRCLRPKSRVCTGEGMPRHCLTLDLQNDPAKIAEYKRYHEKIWPEIRDSLFSAGVTQMEIYLLGTRMFMIMDVTEDFSFEKKAQMDSANPKVLEWEALMANFQAVPEGANPVRRWQPMEKVFDLSKQ